MLGSGVSRHARQTNQPVGRRQIEDDAATALQHGRYLVLHAVEHARNVGIHHLAPSFHVHILQRHARGAGDARIVDSDVQRPKAMQGGIDGVADCVDAAHIGLQRQCACAFGIDAAL